MRFHEGKGATWKPICPWSTGQTPHLRVIVIWVINWDILYQIPQRGHGYCSVASTRPWFSPQKLPAPHLLQRMLLGLLACLLGARSWSRGATTLCRASPPVVPDVCLSPVAC